MRKYTISKGLWASTILKWSDIEQEYEPVAIIQDKDAAHDVVEKLNEYEAIMAERDSLVERIVQYEERQR